MPGCWDLECEICQQTTSLWVQRGGHVFCDDCFRSGFYLICDTCGDWRVYDDINRIGWDLCNPAYGRTCPDCVKKHHHYPLQVGR